MIGAIGGALAGESANAFSVSVARKALDVQEQQGKAAVELIESAVVAPSGKGSLVDTVA